jgi:hypothetical protein
VLKTIGLYLVNALALLCKCKLIITKLRITDHQLQKSIRMKNINKPLSLITRRAGDLFPLK